MVGIELTEGFVEKLAFFSFRKSDLYILVTSPNGIQSTNLATRKIAVTDQSQKTTAQITEAGEMKRSG